MAHHGAVTGAEDGVSVEINHTVVATGKQVSGEIRKINIILRKGKLTASDAKIWRNVQLVTMSSCLSIKEREKSRI